MKRIALSLSILLFGGMYMAYAAENPMFMKQLKQGISGSVGSQTPSAAFHFCCNNANGRACHASDCASCTAFCSGNMVVDPQTPSQSLPR
ncbi:MAG: hypothetical protein H6959_09090 [Chromatiaceae bacterium]|nr:hypothetical protein [Chromatiaceae bacterium]MCP5423065.1 hypothetical protein [Chromatiaceae bacterium]